MFNEASQVVLVRDGDRTVMTMVNDFKGDLREFAVVIPVPTFLRREQIHVVPQYRAPDFAARNSLFDHNLRVVPPRGFDRARQVFRARYLGDTEG